jgi:hypothetical protein
LYEACTAEQAKKTKGRALALLQENGLANAPLIEKSRILNDRYEKEALKHSKKAGLTQQAPFLA